MKATTLIPRGLAMIVSRNTCSGWARESGHLDYVRETIREKYGFTELGNGAYSVVYAHPTHPNKVIKITLSRTDGYHKYIEWLEKAFNFLPKVYTRHLPIIYETKKLKGGGRITVLEKLSPDRSNVDNCYRFEAIKGVIEDTCVEYRVSTDIGGSNVMVRKAKNRRDVDVSVITDPWC